MIPPEPSMRYPIKIIQYRDCLKSLVKMIHRIPDGMLFIAHFKKGKLRKQASLTQLR